MNISCTENDKCLILGLHSNVLTFELIFQLKKILKELPQNESVALNLQEVSYINAEFLEFLKESSNDRKISLINLQSEIFALLNLTKYDKFANIFLNDIDFIEQKRALLNRRFSLIPIGGNF